MSIYSVIVGNVGTIHTGTNKRAAVREFNAARDAACGAGRDHAESVTLFCDGEPVQESRAVPYEYTDTFSGEANYCWVQRGIVHAVSDLDAVRRAKAAVGLAGMRCERSDYGDMIDLRPRGCCTVLFVGGEP